MELLKTWDPFHLSTVPKFKNFVMILLYIALGAGAIATLIYLILEIFSERGNNLSRYKKKVKQWNRGKENLKLSNISIALSITPSKNTMHNIIEMDYYTEGLLEEKKLKTDYNYSEAFFYFNKTKHYFPPFHFAEDDVPVSNPQSFCIHLTWGPRRSKSTYNDVEGFNECSNAFNPKIIWKDHNSKYGIDVYTIKEISRELKACNTKDSCQKECNSYKGIAKEIEEGKYECYSYKVLTDICLMIKGTEAGWKYEGGCFAESSPSRMVDAEPGNRYTFESVRIQVRSYLDPYIVATTQNAEDDNFSFGVDVDFLYSITFLIMFSGIICGVIVAAAVLLKEPISKTQLFVRLFKDPVLFPPSPA